MLGETSSETRRGETLWSPRDLRAYLLSLSYNAQEKDFCLEYQRFPKRIDLSSDWYETLGQMRTQTASDNHEYWSLIGVTRSRDKVVVMQEFVRGERDQVSAQEIGLAQLKAVQHGVPFLVGDVHSHPAGNIERLMLTDDCFSVSDLYSLLHSRHAYAAKFLAGPSLNMAAFRSHESELLPSSLSQESFERYWDRHTNFRSRLGDSLADNLAIGKRHSLVFYEGKPNQPLIRIVP